MTEAIEDRLIKRLLGVSLEPVEDGEPRIYLSELAQELIDEGAESLLLSKDNLDRALMARLMLPRDENSQWLVFYLLDVYSKTQNELRVQNNLKDKALAQHLTDVCANAQELAVSHVHLVLTVEGMFPEAQLEAKLGAAALVQAMDFREGNAGAGGAVAMPAGFLEHFASQYEEEGLSDIVTAMCNTINAQLLRVDLLGEWQRPLMHLTTLASITPIARAMTEAANWAQPAEPSQGPPGRGFASGTILGPAFALSSIPDLDLMRGRPIPSMLQGPNVAERVFKNAETAQSEAASGIASIKLTAQALHMTQWNLVMAFLKPQRTREAMLKWFAAALELNREHEKQFMDATKAAPRGFMLNLATVLLKVCEPFLDPRSGKAWGKIDARYVLESKRLDYSEETRFHFLPEEQRAYQERLQSNANAETSQQPFQPHFICECYFLTLRAMHLGVVSLLNFLGSLPRSRQRLGEELAAYRAELEQVQAAGSGNGLAVATMTAHVQHLDKTARMLTGVVFCIQAELAERHSMENTFGLYRLTAAWLLREASPSFSQGLPLELPLPAKPSQAFKALPEYILSDMVEIYKQAAHLPEISAMLEASPLEEVVMLITAFMPATEYINNIYLRAQLAEMLGVLMPEQEEEQNAWRRRSRRQLTSGDAVGNLLAISPVVQNNLVRGLLQLFVEVERTGRNNQFYEKFYIRYDIGQILRFLWNEPSHREKWIRLAEQQADLYSRFNFFLETDATLHLDDALRLLQEIRDYEQLPEEKQREHEQLSQHRQKVNEAAFHLQHAIMMLRLINMTVPVISKPWLQDQAVKRIAGTLNYFLKYLTGPERNKLNVKNRAEMKFDPQEFLKQISSIYVHFTRNDSTGIFAQAIAADKRSYYEGMFDDATKVLRHFNLLPEDDLLELDNLAIQTSTAVQILEAEDAAEAEAPEEFFDPIMSEIMTDPVTLPSGVNVERESIVRHMMSDPTDPFSRVPLTVADLKPNGELKAQIFAWRAQHRAGKGDAMEQ